MILKINKTFVPFNCFIIVYHLKHTIDTLKVLNLKTELLT